MDGLKVKGASSVPKSVLLYSLDKESNLFFFNVGPPKEDIFLTTFYGLYVRKMS